MRNKTPGENIFVSPLSAYDSLLLAYFGSEDETMDSIHDVLNFYPGEIQLDKFEEYFKVKDESLSKQLKSIAKIYVTNTAKLT